MEKKEKTNIWQPVIAVASVIAVIGGYYLYIDSSVKAQIKPVETKITRLEQQNVANILKLASFKNELELLRKDVNILTKDVDILTKDVDILKKDVGDIKTNILKISESNAAILSLLEKQNEK
jgi:uncharacterized protein YoxC